MTRPLELLAVAERLLFIAGGADPATLRRSISTAYYALFHLLTGEAARTISKGGAINLQTVIARGADHRDVRKVCGFVVKPPVPARLKAAFVEPISPNLRTVCQTFLTLQDGRYAADYDLSNDPLPAEAVGLVEAARKAFDAYARVAGEPNTQGFLIALLLSDRWIRGG